MKSYIDLVERVLRLGEKRVDRTGVGTRSVFGGHIEFDLRDRFPLVTCKETRWKVAFLEMLFFIAGKRNVGWLNDRGSTLWDAWAKDGGDLGPIYGVNWREWEGLSDDGTRLEIDQLQALIDGITEDPNGRRHIVTAWNVAQLRDMALPPCHLLFQCYASDDGHLDMQVYQRSWDLALGAPFNISGYALLLHILSRATRRTPRMLSFVFGDAHIYENHVEAMKGVIAKGPVFDQAELVIATDNTDIDGYKLEDFSIKGYQPREFVKLPVAV